MHHPSRSRRSLSLPKPSRRSTKLKSPPRLHAAKTGSRGPAVKTAVRTGESAVATGPNVAVTIAVATGAMPDLVLAGAPSKVLRKSSWKN